MSAETIAALNAAAEAYNGKAQEIENRVAAALATVPAQSKSFTVNQITGDDTAQGNLADPLKTFQEAFNRTPSGGYCNITLITDYHFSKVEVPRGIFVNIKGFGVEKLTFSWAPENSDPTKINRLNSFSPREGSQFLISNLDIELPADPAETFSYNHMKAVIASTTSQMPAQTIAKFVNCHFTHNSGTHATIFGANQSFIIHRSANCTYQSGFAGKVLHGYGGTGVDPTSLGHVINTDMVFI